MSKREGLRSSDNEQPESQLPKEETLEDIEKTFGKEDSRLLYDARVIVDRFIQQDDIKGLKETIKIKEGENKFPLYDINDKKLLRKISGLFSDEIKEKMKARESEGKEIEKSREALQGKLPVLIHRWHEDGEGWAFHPGVDIYKVLDHEDVGNFLYKADKYGDFKIKMSDSWFIVTVRPDITSKDVIAKGRSPFYLTATVVYGREPTGEKLAKIYEQLKTLPEIESKGSNSHLFIEGK